MNTGYKIGEQGEIHFLTFQIVKWIDLFSRRDWILNLFEFSAKQHIRNEKYQIWTHENHAEIIYTNKFIDQKIRYIHENPVRAGIVQNAEDYLYSSARNYAGLSCVLEICVVPLGLESLPLMRSIR